MKDTQLLRRKSLQWFYLATPVFFIFDMFGGINVRVVFLDSLPALKYLYYGITFGCGFYISQNPQRSNLVSLAECSVNPYYPDRRVLAYVLARG